MGVRGRTVKNMAVVSVCLPGQNPARPCTVSTLHRTRIPFTSRPSSYPPKKKKKKKKKKKQKSISRMPKWKSIASQLLIRRAFSFSFRLTHNTCAQWIMPNLLLQILLGPAIHNQPSHIHTHQTTSFHCADKTLDPTRIPHFALCIELHIFECHPGR